jgi:hypothetical protein
MDGDLFGRVRYPARKASLSALWEAFHVELVY